MIRKFYNVCRWCFEQRAKLGRGNARAYSGFGGNQQARWIK